MILRALSSVLVAAGIAAWLGVADRHVAQLPAIVFSPEEKGGAIVIPARAIAEERRAAEMLRATLAKAAGLGEDAFPIRREGSVVERAALYVGATRRSADFVVHDSPPPFDAAVGWRARGGAIVLLSARRQSVEMAASWFLERHVGAHWFMPGRLGEFVPSRAELVLAPTTEIARPGFFSRELSGMAGADGKLWHARNRLEHRLDQGHTFARVFRPEDLRREPALAPWKNGAKYFPAAGDDSWQPDLTSPAAVAHAATAANRAFAADPGRHFFALGVNDSIRFDESPATLAAVAPAHFFRDRPDYSPLLFRFLNDVAARVQVAHPDRWLPTYAYYWAENAPPFPVARNVVPILTADRSQWCDPDFAAEDQRLIRQWMQSGAGLVATYDFYYGAPYLVPRPTLYAVKESIPFLHHAGVRAFYAEASPNWSLDGPKPWLAAQLLWRPETDPAALLDTYYREFWVESAAPMRRFFDLCDEAWRQQPRPTYWIKFFQDDDQVVVFPPAMRQALREQLDAAARVASTDAVRDRVAFVRAGFSVSEAFAEFCAARARLGSLVAANASTEETLAAGEAYWNARTAFIERNADVRAAFPRALAPQNIGLYLRNDPAARALLALLRRSGGSPDRFAGLPWLPPLAPRAVAALADNSPEALSDATWSKLTVGPTSRSNDYDWALGSSGWRGYGEPTPERSVALVRGPSGPALRISGAKRETLSQWVRVENARELLARVSVRARVSPGNSTYLIVSFLDANGKSLGNGTSDRLGFDPGERSTELCVIARVPSAARWIGFGLYAINQVNDDFAEFSAPSLRVK